MEQNVNCVKDVSCLEILYILLVKIAILKNFQFIYLFILKIYKNFRVGLD